MTVTLSPDDFEALRRLIQATSGIWLGDSKIVFLQVRLAERLQALSISSAREYYHFLKYDPNGNGELQNLIDQVTINETWFFRETEPILAWRDAALPNLLHKHNRIRIWSAGCSTGEEPFTLAMILSEAFPASAAAMFEIVGSDISQRALQTGRTGEYDPHSLRHTEPMWRDKYLEPLGQNGTRSLARWRISEKLQRFVRFQQANLLEAGATSLIGPVDLALCRNVMIYFTEETRQILLTNLYEALRPGGHLILGHSESLAHVTSPFELVHVNGVIMYRKPIN